MSPALAQPAINSAGWKHYVNDDWFDRPELARDPDLERLAFRLERAAKEKPYALASNEELMAALGISKNTLAALLTRYERAGWGRRVLIPAGPGRATGRLGFVLFVRPTNRPVATPASFDQVVKMMLADIHRTKGRPRTVPFAPPGPDRSPIPGHRGPQFLGTDAPQILGTALYFERGRSYGAKNNNDRRVVVVVFDSIQSNPGPGTAGSRRVPRPGCRRIPSGRCIHPCRGRGPSLGPRAAGGAGRAPGPADRDPGPVRRRLRQAAGPGASDPDRPVGRVPGQGQGAGIRVRRRLAGRGAG